MSDLIASPGLGGLDQIVSSEAAVRADPVVPDLTPLAPAGAVTAGGDIAGFAPGASLSLGAGRDVLVLCGNRDDWLVEADPSGEVTLTPRDLDGTLSSVSAGRVSDVEALRFVGQDTANVLDDENIHLGRFAESEMARLYAAVFGREPDGPGLDYWITLRTDALTAQEVADRFMGSQEYIDRYGTDLSDQAFLNALYANVLGRDPDPDGNTYWRDQLSVGQRDRADVLVNVTNSAENVANTQHYIADLSAPWSNAPVGTTSTSAVNALVAPDWDGIV